MRSASANTAFISCSTRTMVTSFRSSCSSFTMRADSVTPSPAIGSSSSSNCGLVASATASSSSRCSPWLSFDTSTWARSASPTRCNAACAASRSPFSCRASAKKRNEWPSCACAASATLSAAVKSSSSEVTWNERASPSALRRQAGKRVMSRPASETLPASGVSCPVNWLISVVLPAPFGPMMAWSSPRATSSETRSVATMPPKRRIRSFTQSRGSATGQSPEQTRDAAAPEQHDEQEHRPHDQRPIFRDLRQQFFQQEIDHGADHRAEQRAHAAQNHHHHEIARTGPVHHGRADEVGVDGKQRAGESAQGARDDEAHELVALGRKADRLHALLVRAQALHDETEARIDDTPDQHDHAEQAGEAEIIKLHAVGEVDEPREIAALVDGEPVIAAVTRKPRGDVIGHLRKGERDHDEVDAAGTKRQRADDERKQRGGCERHGKLQESGAKSFLRQDADGIAADAEIGGMAKAHHAAITHDQIEARRRQRQDHDAGE